VFEGTTAGMRRTIFAEDWRPLEMVASATEHRETIATLRTIWPEGGVHWIEPKGRGRYGIDGTWVRIKARPWTSPSANSPKEALRSAASRESG